MRLMRKQIHEALHALSSIEDSGKTLPFLTRLKMARTLRSLREIDERTQLMIREAATAANVDEKGVIQKEFAQQYLTEQARILDESVELVLTSFSDDELEKSNAPHQALEHLLCLMG